MFADRPCAAMRAKPRNRVQARKPKKEHPMRIAREWYLGAAVVGFAAALAMAPAKLSAQVTIDADDIGGVVTGPSGPEAGVWVIAETTELGTTMARMVVTDDEDRYGSPELPTAK